MPQVSRIESQVREREQFNGAVEPIAIDRHPDKPVRRHILDPNRDPGCSLQLRHSIAQKMIVGLAPGKRHRHKEASLPVSEPVPCDRPKSERQMGHHRRRAQFLRQRHRASQPAQLVVRPVGHLDDKGAVDHDDGHTEIVGQTTQISWLASVPTIVYQHLDAIVAGLGGHFKNTASSIGV